MRRIAASWPWHRSLSRPRTVRRRPGRPPQLAAVARAARHRRLAHRQSAARVERDEEHPLEGARFPGRGSGVARRLGRPGVRARRPCRSASTGDAQHAPRGGAASRAASHRFVVMALDRNTGKTLWERVAARSRSRTKRRTRERHLGLELRRSPTAQRVFAYFESFGLYAYDMNGKLLWEKDLGDKRMRNQFGEGSHAGAPRQHARHRLGSPEGAVLHRRARQARRQGAVAGAAQGDRHLGHAAGRRGRTAARR